MGTIKKIIMASTISMPLLTSAAFAADNQALKQKVAEGTLQEANKIVELAKKSNKGVECLVARKRIYGVANGLSTKYGLKKEEKYTTMLNSIEIAGNETGLNKCMKPFENARFSAEQSGIQLPGNVKPAILSKKAGVNFTRLSPQQVKVAQIGGGVLLLGLLANEVFDNDDDNDEVCMSGSTRIDCDLIK